MGRGNSLDMCFFSIVLANEYLTTKSMLHLNVAGFSMPDFIVKIIFTYQRYTKSRRKESLSIYHFVSD